MTNNKYIVKSLTPWMVDELIAFSEYAKFDLILLRSPDDFYAKGLSTLSENGINVIYKPYGGGVSLKKYWLALIFLLRNIGKIRFDYNLPLGLKSLYWFCRLDLDNYSKDSNIHAQFATQPALIALLIKKYFNDKPTFSFTFHAYDIYFKNRWFNLLLDTCENAFSISNYNIDYVQNNYKSSKKIKLSRLGVFRKEFKDSPKDKNDEFVLGLVSWFVEKKGIIYLLKAFKKLKESNNTSVKLVLAGAGPLKDDILSFIEKEDLTGSITYIGKINNDQKIDFFNSLDAFILPCVTLKSDQDGIPVVLMEAIAIGLPLISTNVSGIPEICVNNFNGFLVEEREENLLFEAIEKLQSNSELQAEFSMNSSSLSQEYDILLNSRNKIKQLGWKIGI